MCLHPSRPHTGLAAGRLGSGSEPAPGVLPCRGPDEDGEEEAAPGPRQAHDSRQQRPGHRVLVRGAGSRRGVGRRGRGRRPCGAPRAPLRENLGGPEQGPVGQSEGASLGAARALGGVAQANQARGHDEATRLGGGCVRRVWGCRGRQPGAGRVVGGHPGGLWLGRGSLGSSPGLLCQGHGRLRPLLGAACRVATRTHRAGEGRAQ